MNNKLNEIINSINNSLISSSFIGGYITNYNLQEAYYKINNQSIIGNIYNKSFYELTLEEKANLLNSELKNYVIEFVKRVSKIPNINLDHLNNKLDTLKINEKYKFKNLFRRNKCVALYDDYNNEINIFDIFEGKKCLYHELFHLASSYYDEESNIYYSGFVQTKLPKYTSYGKGLNEGYTQLLTLRYFNDLNITNCYNKEVKIANSLENIIGQDKMTELYFNADLYGLSLEMRKYGIDQKEFIKFLLNVDLLTEKYNLDDENERNKYVSIMQEVHNLFAYCEFYKLFKQYKDSKINDFSIILALKNLSDYIESGVLKIFEYKYNLYNLDKLNERIENDFGFKIGRNISFNTIK
jgi:hypothetical protein